MASLFFRNLLFTILQPGVVVGLLPYWILGNGRAALFGAPIELRQYAAALLFFAGLAVMCWCIFQFAVQGRGTLSPADPTKRLVVSGLYRYSRNPMYVGVVMALVGECVFTKNMGLWIYTAVVFAAFHLFVTLREEARLRRDFGEEYLAYCREVRRWF